jgi:hypothetical protein
MGIVVLKRLSWIKIQEYITLSTKSHFSTSASIDSDIFFILYSYEKRRCEEKGN